MLRDPFKQREDKRYSSLTLIMESAKEMQEYSRAFPQTEDLPSDEEHHVVHRTENRNGHNVLVIEVGVRKREQQGKPESDGLNGLPDEDLEVRAAQAGLDVGKWRKLSSRANRIKAIREAKTEAVTA